MTTSAYANLPLFEQPTTNGSREDLTGTVLLRREGPDGLGPSQFRYALGTLLNERRAPMRATLGYRDISSSDDETYVTGTVLGIVVVNDVAYLRLVDTRVRFEAITAFATD